MADNGRQAVTLTRRLKPDVVIMDIAMPELNGIDATRQIVDEVPGVKVIALSMHSEKQFVEGMLRAGVAGYLLKESAFEELIKAIRIVCAGKKYLSPDVTDIVLRDYLSPPDENDREQTPDLTLREREVLQLVAEGRATRRSRAGSTSASRPSNPTAKTSWTSSTCTPWPNSPSTPCGTG